MLLGAVGIRALISDERNDQEAPARQVSKGALLRFVSVPAGHFVRGTDGGSWDEKPEHSVHIQRPFEIGEAPVGNALFELFDPAHREKRGAYGSAAGDEDPVVCVSWEQANAFCRWLCRRDGPLYRLPTEAEWEYAARTKAQALTGLTRVENWCHDWYGPYVAGEAQDPLGYADGDFRVTRGGGFRAVNGAVRATLRLGALPQDTENHAVGFRLVRGAELSGIALAAQPAREWSSSVGRERHVWEKPKAAPPFFAEPLQYVRIPAALQQGPLYTEHNHVPGITWCDNGDLLAIWYSTLSETGRELVVAAARLRSGSDAWDPADVFWAAPNRNNHAPALWNDGAGTLYHFNGLAAEGGWSDLAAVLRTSVDSGITWSAAKIIAPRYGWGNMPISSVFRRADGAICLPCDADPGPIGGTVLHVSRDSGATWARLDHATSDRPTFAPSASGSLIAGIHAGIDTWTDGSIVAVGRGDTIEGRLARSVSHDNGRTWTYSATPFEPIGGGQRAILRRIVAPDGSPALMVVSFAKAAPFPDPAGGAFTGSGMFVALSFDGGVTWPKRRLVTDGVQRILNGYGWTHTFQMDATHAEPAGYLAATQAPDGTIHLISSGVHYRFNYAWAAALDAAAGASWSRAGAVGCVSRSCAPSNASTHTGSH